jgi:hypothetical protein
MAWCVTARADGIVASPCNDDVWQCEEAGIFFEKTDALPIEFQFDTGWVPPSSPLQVHLWGMVAAHTRVSLAGFLRTNWPEALTLATPGAPGSALGFHYGVETGAEASITVEVLNQEYNWTGDIPYVPQIDFQVEGSQSFEGWAWPPGVSASSTTQPQTVAQFDLLSLVGGSIPGFEGGFQLDVALELEVAYWTDRIVVTTSDGTTVAGGYIVGDGDTSGHDYDDAPFVDFDVHPEGTVRYDGVVHLLPTLYIEIFGNPQTLQLADIPIDLPDEEQTWIFDTQRVHVPLPVIAPTAQGIDFGKVSAEEEAFSTFQLKNDGEADLRVELSTTHPAFEVTEEVLEIAPGTSEPVTVWFRPGAAAKFEAELLLVSNDPDDPEKSVWLTGGDGAAGFVPVVYDDPMMEAEGSCGCRVAPANSTPWPLALLALLFTRSRAASAGRRRRCPEPSSRRR